jgi:hypothetical protein
MGTVDLPQKNEVKYLGMHLDRRLTWAKHIKKKKAQSKSETNALATRKKINTINRIMIQIFSHLRNNLFIYLYYMFRPRVDHGSSSGVQLHIIYY